MASGWGEEIFGTVLGGLPAVNKLVPRRFRQRAIARLNDVNPFASIAANEDLLRALRLAWIEAALQIDCSVVQTCATPEWASQSRDIQRFSTVLITGLRALRAEAFDRDVHPGHAPMDRHLRELVVDLPATMTGNRAAAGEAMTESFRENVAAVSGWPIHEVPSLHEQIARQGLPVPGASSRRTFGDLVYAVFAETIKSPDRYPEASQAFVIAIGGFGVELGQQCLELLRGQDARLDRLLDSLGGTSIEGGLAAWLGRVDAEWTARWQVLSDQVSVVDAKIDLQTGMLDRMQEQLAQLVAAIEAKGQIGSGPGQLAHNTVLSLAKRLRPDDLIEFDRAVQELDAAVSVALELIAKGHSSYYQDLFVDEVLVRVRQSIEEGQLEQGAQSIDQALAELDRREAGEREAARRRRVQLLEASVSQAMLLRQPQRVADAVERLVGIHHPVCAAASELFKNRLRAYCAEGEERGLRLPLEVAEALARRRLAVAGSREERGEALVWLGTALAVLGKREPGTERLLQAAQAFRAASQECMRERVPLEWATTQNNLANVLSDLGRRESGTERLEEAVQAYLAALQECTRERAPRDWAMTQNNLGTALKTLGERDVGTERLQQAVQAYQAALQERTRECVPLEWAMTQHNLGTALKTLGERDGGTERLQQAVQAYQAALQERTRERVPMHWAMTQMSLGNALKSLGEREGGIVRLQQAVQAYLAALQEYTRERVPLEWAMTQNNLGSVLTTLGERENGTERLEQAVQACEAALRERTRERAPLAWAMTQNNLGNALKSLGEREGGIERLQQAVQTYLAALQEYTRERAPMHWAMTQNNLGDALTTLGERENDPERLHQAVRAYEAALTVITRETAPYHLEIVQRSLAKCRRLINKR